MSRAKRSLWAAALLALCLASLGVGAGDVDVFTTPEARLLLLESRAPRTAALLLAGASTAIAGALMQMLAQNRFVEPSTVGVAEGAALGALLVWIWAPEAHPALRMCAAALTGMASTAFYMRLVRAAPRQSFATAPLIGMVFGGMIGGLAGLIAWRFDMLQAFFAWMTGDFGGVLRGRYELLWISGALGLAVWAFADRFTLVGLGRGLAESVGLDWRRTVATGLAIVAAVTACNVVTVGVLPFLGLVAPNVASRLIGDNLRASLPYVAMLGAGLTLFCDVLGRLVIRPYEIPIGATMGVIGAAAFLHLLLRRASHAA